MREEGLVMGRMRGGMRTDQPRVAKTSVIPSWAKQLLAGIAAGFINVMAGGGSTITLPILIFLGLDGSVANGTNRIAIFLQNITGVLSFKQEKYSDFRFSFKLAVWTLPGAIAGAFFATKLSNEAFNIVLGIIMIGVVISMLIPKKKLTAEFNKSDINWKTYVMMFGIGIYGGFVQVGVVCLCMRLWCALVCARFCCANCVQLPTHRSITHVT